MVKDVVEAFVDAKMARPDISAALYQISANVGGPALVKKALQRQRKAVDAMLQTAPDTEATPDKFIIDIMFAAMGGAMRSVLEAGATPALVRKLREQLVLLCQSYMSAATHAALSNLHAPTLRIAAHPTDNGRR
jgi:hypothetical protein